MSNITHSTPPVRILVLDKYIEIMSDLLQVPHELLPYNGETNASFVQKLHESDVLIGSLIKGEWLQADSPLRLVQGIGAGTENVDFAGLPPGCTVCNVYGHEWAVAEYCFMTMAMLNREIVRQDTALRIGYWSGGIFRNELRGRQLLIIGLGHIGAEVARWGHFYGMQVSGLTRSPSAARGQALGLQAIGGYPDLHTYLPEADFVVVAIPETAVTASFIGQAELEAMQRSAFLINVARGPVVDEQSLFVALRDKMIAGAAVDVWYNYPHNLNEICMPANYPFHELPNIILSPHNAGTTNGTMNYRFEFIAANIGRFYRGESLENIVHIVSER